MLHLKHWTFHPYSSNRSWRDIQFNLDQPCMSYFLWFLLLFIGIHFLPFVPFSFTVLITTSLWHKYTQGLVSSSWSGSFCKILNPFHVISKSFGALHILQNFLLSNGRNNVIIFSRQTSDDFLYNHPIGYSFSTCAPLVKHLSEISRNLLCGLVSNNLNGHLRGWSFTIFTFSPLM